MMFLCVLDVLYWATNLMMFLCVLDVVGHQSDDVSLCVGCSGSPI